jgi:hypothetical protein
MEEKARRLTRETTSRGEEKVGGYQAIGDVRNVNFARDSRVLAGRAGLFEKGAAIRSEPSQTRRETAVSRVKGASGGPEVS